jgi:multiple sugar transport system permease protein
LNNQASTGVDKGRRGRLFAGLTEDTLSGAARRKELMAYAFLLPTILGILVFTAGPVVASLGLSLYQWNVFQPPVFIGVDNYQRLIKDTRVAVSFWNTTHFVLLAVFLQIAISLALALGMQRLRRTGLRYYTRTAYFLPFLMSGAATAIVLGYMLHHEFGAVNYYLGRLGIPRVPWLTSPGWVLNTIVMTYIWQHMGFTLILFIGGLNNISPEILDAADVDGSAGWHRLWHVTLPMLSPTLLFAAVVGVIGALQIFDLPYVMTRGGPGDASRTAVMVMYESAFKNMEIGYGSGMAVILFLLILTVTAVQFWLSKRWVFYQ